MIDPDLPGVEFFTLHELAEKFAQEALVFHGRGNELMNVDPVAARQQWRLAKQKYEEGLRYDPDSPLLMRCLAGLLSEEAEYLEQDDLSAAIANWQLALNLYSRLALALPDAWQAWYHWGDALHRQAHAVCMQDMPMARESWHFACQKYERAFKVDPTQLGSLLGWAVSLAAESEAEALFHQNYDLAGEKWPLAEQKFTQLFEIDPLCDGLMLQWCIQLVARAESIAEHDPAQANLLRAKTIEKAKQGLFFDPENTALLHVWGNILLDQAREAMASDAELGLLLLQQAVEKLSEHAQKGSPRAEILIGVIMSLECQTILTTDPLLLQELSDNVMMFRQQLEELIPSESDDEDSADLLATEHGPRTQLH